MAVWDTALEGNGQETDQEQMKTLTGGAERLGLGGDQPATSFLLRDFFLIVRFQPCQENPPDSLARNGEVR